MKIILSRKGFDSSAGGVASPILPDGRMYSLPIPDRASPLSYETIDPQGSFVTELTHGRVGPRDGAHLDPDLVAASIPRDSAWRPLFGQAGNEQRVLEREGVGPGDLFLFFGWFRRVERRNGQLGFIHGAPDLHVLWGWLQIGAIHRVASNAVPAWAMYHPHVASPEGRNYNTVYFPSESLVVGRNSLGIPGAGVFGTFDDRRCLTAPGKTRSIWSLPRWFLPAGGRPPLGFHGSAARWSLDGDHVLLRTVGRVQEFVLHGESYPEATEWVMSLFS